MKEFLIKTIENLWALTGVDQEKDLIAKSRKSNGEIEYKNGVHIAVTELIHILLTECNRFKIPDEKKQELIEKGIKSEVASGYFRGLNAGLINKWLYAYKVSNEKAGHPENDSEYYLKIERNNRNKYTKILQDKRAINPDYDPFKEFQNMVINIGKLPPKRFKAQTKREQYFGNGVEDVTYEEVETKK